MFYFENLPQIMNKSSKYFLNFVFVPKMNSPWPNDENDISNVGNLLKPTFSRFQEKSNLISRKSRIQFFFVSIYGSRVILPKNFTQIGYIPQKSYFNGFSEKLVRYPDIVFPETWKLPKNLQ